VKRPYNLLDLRSPDRILPSLRLEVDHVEPEPILVDDAIDDELLEGIGRQLSDSLQEIVGERGPRVHAR